MMNTTRRGLITGLVAFVAAPAIVRATSIMPVKAWSDRIGPLGITLHDSAGPYDMFLWNDNGVWRMTPGPTWNDHADTITGLPSDFAA
jgi:hypothetical protein